MLFLGRGEVSPQRGYFGCASIRRAPLMAHPKPIGTVAKTCVPTRGLRGPPRQWG